MATTKCLIPLATAYQGALVPGRRSFRRRFHRHRARIHFQIGGWVLRQRGHRHLRPNVHLLPVDQGRQDRIHVLGRLDCSLILLHGKCMLFN
jgi:hypothetical protein